MESFFSAFCAKEVAYLQPFSHQPMRNWYFRGDIVTECGGIVPGGKWCHHTLRRWWPPMDGSILLVLPVNNVHSVYNGGGAKGRHMEMPEADEGD